MNINGQPRPWSNFQSVPTNLRTTGDGRLDVDNVRWGFDNSQGVELGKTPGVFSNMRIDPEHVKDVYLGVKPFDPTVLAAHSVLVFEMDDQHPVTNSKGQQDSGFVLSPEAHFHEGEVYEMKGSYEMVYQLGSWSDTVEKTTRREGLNQIRYKLDLTPEQKKELCRRSLDLAVQDHTGEKYNMFSNSCHSITVDLVNSVVPEGQKIHRDLMPHVYNPMAVLPPYGDIVFAGHHLLAHEPREVVQTDTGKPIAPTRTSRLLQSLSHTRGWQAACAVTGALVGALAVPLVGPVALAVVPYAAHLGRSLGDTLARRADSVYTPASRYLAGASG